LSFHCLSLIQKKQAAQRAQFPAIERNFPQTSAHLKSGCFQIELYLEQKLIKRADLGSSSRNLLEQKLVYF